MSTLECFCLLFPDTSVFSDLEVCLERETDDVTVSFLSPETNFVADLCFMCSEGLSVGERDR